MLKPLFVLAVLANTCFITSQAHKCNKPNEHYESCAATCPPETCESIGKSYSCPREPPPNCKGDCRCDKGFYRNTNGDCVCEEECEPRCEKDEIYEDRPEYLCRSQTCSQLGFPLNCSSSDSSNYPPKPGCICDHNKVRDNEGSCIPKDQCPSCGGDPNAESGCGINCGRLCSNYKDKNVVCPAVCYDNACDCRKDYVYDSNIKKCVLPENCTPTCGINEVYDSCANGGCRRRKCSEGIICIRPKKCDGGCVCQDGYTRAKNGKCIPENQCPESKCGKNERYEECPENICQPKTCSHLGYPLNCTSIDSSKPCPGKPGCICENGKVRDGEGHCIPKDECPSCGGDPNAKSGCGINCGRLCSNYKDKNVACPAVCYDNACDCRKGYVYDSNLKKCVLPKNCTPTCGINEVYDTCANGGCRRRKCSEQTICIDPAKCQDGCVCQDGYTRAKNGKCIPEDQCPESQCGKDERYDECPDNICQPKTCSQLGYPLNCTSIDSSKPCPGQPGCICDNGKVRDGEDYCIPRDQCPSCGGDLNAESGCGINCGRLCSNYKDKNVACIEICYENACDCRKGYVYDENLEKCVLPKDCTPTCAVNEVYTTCSYSGCRRWKCSEGITCIYPIRCQEGCDCREGYTRANNGTCIPENQCPVPQCGKDERYEECPDNICWPKTCSQLGYPLNCTSSDNSKSHCPGKPGCICDDDKVRDKEGYCVPKDQCPTCGGDPNAVSGCGINCGRLCSNYKDKNVTCPRICYDNACDCRKGYVYDENLKKCVLPENCSPTCDINEIYDTCANGGCRRWKCSEKTICIDPVKCQDGCVCRDGYTRTNNGKCIPENQCPAIHCGKDERYEECPDNICLPKTCSQLGYPLNCTLSDSSTPDCPGKPGCICDNDKVRDSKGRCVPKDHCPSCGGDPNAMSGCGLNCGRLCSNYKDQNVPCPKICYDNACDCRKGYVYDENLKKCVLPKNCSPTCGINEVYDTCANGGCRRWKCSEQTICIDPAKCQDGCICREGYTRANNGTCIPENQCPAYQCGEGEKYDECPDNICWPKSCSQLGYPLNCSFADSSNSECPGKPGCICDDGKMRDDKGHCIPTDQCPSCRGDPNAVSGCGINCGRLCSNYKNKNVICPLICIVNACDCREGYVFDENLKKCVLPKDCTPTCSINEVYDTCANGGCRRWKCSEQAKCIDPEKCQDGCVCREGYTRTKNGTCIPENKCPVPQCGKDERYEECPDNICWPKTCSQLGYPLNCTFSHSSKSVCPGKPGCICDNGKVKDSEGCCIPMDQCPSCRGDPNAVSGCGINCGRLCSNYKDKNVVCPAICMINGCDCREGFVYDENLKKCVLPEKCTPTCGINEVYDTCANGGCRRWKCSETTICKDAVKCENGCVCRDGYTRTNNGTCIPENQCPNQCTKPHEYYDDCAPTCPPQTCESIGKKYHCPIQPAVCKGACRCEKGYYRNKVGECISEKDCKKCNKPHEYYDTCPPMCPPQTCESIGKIYSCPANPGVCKGACRCENEYLRNNKGVCVAKEDCDTCGGDPNAVPGCGVNCGRLCSNYNKGPVACPKICKGGCDCKEEFVLDENINKCVLPENCTPVCGENEVYSSCVNEGCKRKKCSEIGEKVRCKKLKPACCKKGCLCMDKYLRANNGTCIPEEQCNEHGTTSPIDKVNKTQAKARLDRGSIALSGEFLYELIQSKPDENFVASATSVLIPLAQIALFAKDVVLKQLLKVLNLKSKHEIKSVYPDETANFKNQPSVLFDVATKYYANENYPLSESFKNASEVYFDASAQNLDFSENVKAADVINDWVSERTRGKIQDLVNADSLNSNTVMVLVNAIYFFGNWTNQFDEKRTEKRNFTKLNNDVVQLDIMYQENNFRYTENNKLKIQALELPYKGGNFSFLVILPQNDYFDETVEALRNPDVFTDIINSLINEKVKVYLPKMRINTDIDMAEMLAKDNVTEMFKPNSDSFKGILKDDQPLYVSAAVQKAFIEVNERGTEAAAATAVVVSTLSAVFPPPEILTFNANHPFIFYLLLNGVPVFCGSFVGGK